MFGDTPPAVVAVDGKSVAAPGLVDLVRAHLVHHPIWLVTEEGDALRQRLLEADLGANGPGLQVIDGDAAKAVDVAAARGSDMVRLWLDIDNPDALPMPVRVAAHDAGITLRLEAPFASGAGAA